MAIEPRLRAILEFAEKLTLDPAGVVREDLESLRTAVLDDRAILEVVEVVDLLQLRESSRGRAGSLPGDTVAAPEPPLLISGW